MSWRSVTRRATSAAASNQRSTSAGSSRARNSRTCSAESWVSLHLASFSSRCALRRSRRPAEGVGSSPKRSVSSGRLSESLTDDQGRFMTSARIGPGDSRLELDVRAGFAFADVVSQRVSLTGAPSLKLLAATEPENERGDGPLEIPAGSIVRWNVDGPELPVVVTPTVSLPRSGLCRTAPVAQALAATISARAPVVQAVFM